MNDLAEARAEIASNRALLAAAFEREKHQQAVIDGLRRELLECRDRLGRDHCDLEDSNIGTVSNPFREFPVDRRKTGGFPGVLTT